jgi:hypothetical protein
MSYAALPKEEEFKTAPPPQAQYYVVDQVMGMERGKSPSLFLS